jgi:signal transduction histidine kinase
MDSEQIYQVVFNIVFNATQAMPYGGDIVVQTKAAQNPSTVVLEISDTGIGIPAEKIDQIFTPFYTDKNRGTGLGLTIAKNIVEKHKGTIAVSSRPDEGSLFSVTLPVKSSEPTLSSQGGAVDDGVQVPPPPGRS